MSTWSFRGSKSGSGSPVEPTDLPQLSAQHRHPLSSQSHLPFPGPSAPRSAVPDYPTIPSCLLSRAASLLTESLLRITSPLAPQNSFFIEQSEQSFKIHFVTPCLTMSITFLKAFNGFLLHQGEKNPNSFPQCGNHTQCKVHTRAL